MTLFRLWPGWCVTVIDPNFSSNLSKIKPSTNNREVVQKFYVAPTSPTYQRAHGLCKVAKDIYTSKIYSFTIPLV